MLKTMHLLAAGALVFTSLVGSAANAQQSDGREASVAGDVARAQSLYESGRSEAALDVVDKVLSRSAGDAEARFLQGLIYADMGRRTDAIEVFSALTRDFPELPEPWNNLAVLFAENGEFDKARQALLAAIQTHPSYSTAHENLGDLYARMASMAYDRALEQDRGNESARLKLSAVNGLFSVPSLPPTQVAAVTQAPSTPAAAPQPEPEPVSAPPPTQVAATRPEPEPVLPQPQPVAAQPTAQPASPAPADVFSREVTVDAVSNAVRSWAASWSAQDVDGYLTSYAPSFRPSNGASRASWNRYRRDRLTRPSFIQVDISNLSVNVVDERNATATFNQRYRSDNYEDNVRKTLQLVQVDGRWQIASETSESV